MRLLNIFFISIIIGSVFFFSSCKEDKKDKKEEKKKETVEQKSGSGQKKGGKKGEQQSPPSSPEEYEDYHSYDYEEYPSYGEEISYTAVVAEDSVTDDTSSIGDIIDEIDSLSGVAGPAGSDGLVGPVGVESTFQINYNEPLVEGVCPVLIVESFQQDYGDVIRSDDNIFSKGIKIIKDLIYNDSISACQDKTFEDYGWPSEENPAVTESNYHNKMDVFLTKEVTGVSRKKILTACERDQDFNENYIKSSEMKALFNGYYIYVKKRLRDSILALMQEVANYDSISQGACDDKGVYHPPAQVDSLSEVNCDHFIDEGNYHNDFFQFCTQLKSCHTPGDTTSLIKKAKAAEQVIYRLEKLIAEKKRSVDREIERIWPDVWTLFRKFTPLQAEIYNEISKEEEKREELLETIINNQETNKIELIENWVIGYYDHREERDFNSLVEAFNLVSAKEYRYITRTIKSTTPFVGDSKWQKFFGPGSGIWNKRQEVDTKRLRWQQSVNNERLKQQYLDSKEDLQNDINLKACTNVLTLLRLHKRRLQQNLASLNGTYKCLDKNQAQVDSANNINPGLCGLKRLRNHLQKAVPMTRLNVSGNYLEGDMSLQARVARARTAYAEHFVRHFPGCLESMRKSDQLWNETVTSLIKDISFTIATAGLGAAASLTKAAAAEKASGNALKALYWMFKLSEFTAIGLNVGIELAEGIKRCTKRQMAKLDLLPIQLSTVSINTPQCATPPSLPIPANFAPSDEQQLSSCIGIEIIKAIKTATLSFIGSLSNADDGLLGLVEKEIDLFGEAFSASTDE